MDEVQLAEIKVRSRGVRQGTEGSWKNQDKGLSASALKTIQLLCDNVDELVQMIEDGFEPAKVFHRSKVQRSDS